MQCSISLLGVYDHYFHTHFTMQYDYNKLNNIGIYMIFICWHPKIVIPSITSVTLWPSQEFYQFSQKQK